MHALFAEVTGDVIVHRRRRIHALFGSVMQCRVPVVVRDVHVAHVIGDQLDDAGAAR